MKSRENFKEEFCHNSKVLQPNDRIEKNVIYTSFGQNLLQYCMETETVFLVGFLGFSFFCMILEICLGFVGPYLEGVLKHVRWLFIQFCMLFWELLLDDF